MKRQQSSLIYRNSVYRRPAAPRKRRPFRKLLAALVVLIVIVGVAYGVSHAMSGRTNTGSSQSASTSGGSTPSSNKGSAAATEPKTATNHCAGNTLANYVLVSIKQQHLWACAGTSEVYASAVVTGMELYPADLTPPGTYHVYAKETDQDLKGCDSTGCWDDHVSYWMPFLDNQYGEYGFHDATWRPVSEFGNVNIYAPYTASVVGSHGCVELPLATAKWLYNWAPVGTTVTIES